MKHFWLTVCACALVFAAEGQSLQRSSLLNRMRGGARGTAAQQQGAGAQEDAKEAIKNAPRGTNGVPALVFNQAPLELVLDAYAEQCGKTIIQAPDLPKSTITLKSLEGQLLTKEEYLEAIEATLTMNGVVLEPFGSKFLRALQRKTIRTQGIRLRLDMPTNAIPEKGRVISQMIRLQYISAEEAQKAIEGFKDPNGLFQVFERTNTILVTDTQENINRMLEVIKELDVSTPVTEDVFVRQIQYATAEDIKVALETIVTESQKETEKETSGAKTSGSLGFGKTQPQTRAASLLGRRLRPGAQQEPSPEPVPNANLVAAVSDADRGMIRGKVLILADERSNKLIVITAKTNMDFFDKVIETLDVETTPEIGVEVIRLKYADAEEVSDMLNDLIGNGKSSSQTKNNQNANTQRGGAANRNLTRSGTAARATRTGTTNPSFSKESSSLGELNKDNVKILADKRINGIVVMARRADMRSVKEVIEDMDVKLSQVLIETVIIEVTLGDDLKTGIDWVQRGRSWGHMTDNGKLDGKKLYWAVDEKGRRTGLQTTDATATITDEDDEELTVALDKVMGMMRGNFWSHGDKGHMLGGGGGTGGGALGSLMDTVVETTTTDEDGNSIASTASAAADLNPIGTGVKYFLKSDKLNLAAIIQASKSDTRAKYIASPIVMTVDNKEATIDATENRQFLTGWTAQSSGYNGGGQPTPSYSAKDIGIKLKITPKINPNGTVMLEVEEEYSQFMKDGQTMLIPKGSAYEQGNVDLAVERKLTADILLENAQTVVLGGLTETSKSESETGIPILKDIPWIGKWLFGSVAQSEARKELLVFMTPYVLDDADAAQAEALRRKKKLSDPRPWEDSGWSASPLADPVSRKEQLRRLNDEWKRQDQERSTQRALEKAKLERMKKLKEMTEEEREFWMELHKEELEEEAKEKEAEQEGLREIVDAIKKRKMDEANEAIDESKTIEKNEYQKMVDQKAKDGTSLPAGALLKRDVEEAKEKKAAAEKTPAPVAKARKPADEVKKQVQTKKTDKADDDS